VCRVSFGFQPGELGTRLLPRPTADSFGLFRVIDTSSKTSAGERCECVGCSQRIVELADGGGRLPAGNQDRGALTFPPSRRKQGNAANIQRGERGTKSRFAHYAEKRRANSIVTNCR
jgi:hypothetical protein